MAKPRVKLPQSRPSQDKTDVLSDVDFRAVPLLRSPKKEREFVNCMLAKLGYSSTERNLRVMRLQDADVQLSGYVTKTKDDRDRDSGNKAGKPPKPTESSLPLAMAQINSSVTYMMSLFAPEMKIFTSVAPADKQQAAQSMTGRLNRDGRRGGYYRQLKKFCANAMKYNIAAMTCFYEEQEGIGFKNAQGQAQKQLMPIWAGNVLKSCDMYNFLFDTTVHPVDLPMKGEFFAEVEMITPWRAKKMFKDRQLFGINRFLDEDWTPAASSNSHGYYGSSFFVKKPSVRDNAGGSRTQDWRGLFRTGPVKDSAPGLETVNMVIWLVPKEHGLSKSADMELWRIKIVNGKYLSFAAKMEDSHGMLPIVCAAPIEDDLDNEQRTFPEQLLPYQHFSSFLMNSHQTAVRKALGGITLYNPHVIAGLDMAKDDLSGARIPMRSTSPDFDIKKAFAHFTDVPETGQHVDMIGKVDGLMQKILPTDTLRQVADLERATLYQAAATVQASDRTNFTIACLVCDQALTPLVLQMVYNIFAKVEFLTFIQNSTGERTDIPIGDLIEKEIEHEIGTGILGLDRLMTIQIMRDVVQSVIQSQQAILELDIVELLNYFASLAGDRTDLTQFRRKTPPVAPPKATPPGVQVGLPGGGETT